MTYVYWDYHFDEWIDAITDRFAPLHTHTYCENGRLQKGQRIEVLDENQQWLEAFVVDEDPEEGNVSVRAFLVDTVLPRGKRLIRFFSRSDPFR